MSFKNLKDFVDFLNKNNELLRISEELQVELEISEITDRVSKKMGTALLSLSFFRSFSLLENRFRASKL